MKQSTSILRGMNDIRADYILESELSAEELAAAYRPTAKERWQRITSSGWFAAAACAVVAFGVLAGIIWAGQRGPGVVTPVGTLHESTVEETEHTEEITSEPIPNALRGLKRETTYNADGTEDSRTKYTYENGLLVKKRYFIGGEGATMSVYTYDENGRLIETQNTFDKAPSNNWTTTYDYDTEGRVIRELYTLDSGQIKGEHLTEYDEKGRVIRYENLSSITTYTYGKHDSYVSQQVYKEEDRVYKVEVFMDERGNILRRCAYENDEWISESIITYNEEGQRTEFESLDSSGGHYRFVYEYENGTLVRATTYNGDALASTTYYEYNEYGECIKEELWDAEGNLFSRTVREYGTIS